MVMFVFMIMSENIEQIVEYDSKLRPSSPMKSALLFSVIAGGCGLVGTAGSDNIAFQFITTAVLGVGTGVLGYYWTEVHNSLFEDVYRVYSTTAYRRKDRTD